ncbi:MAG: hypothetical protein QM755_00540 [Luteolibacter sp.]
MKPRINLATATLADGTPLELQEHDGRHSLVIRGQEIAGPSTRTAEEECARLACAPFRPVRQPKIWLGGLGLGQALAAACESLLQKRATFFVAEPLQDLTDWQKTYFPDGAYMKDTRVQPETRCRPLRAGGAQRHAARDHRPHRDRADRRERQIGGGEPALADRRL